MFCVFLILIAILGPTVENSLSLLHEAKNHLQKVLQQKMDESIKDADAASVERFFKLFPLLNMHEEGIFQLSSYLAIKVCLFSMMMKKNMINSICTLF